MCMWWFDVCTCGMWRVVCDVCMCVCDVCMYVYVCMYCMCVCVHVCVVFCVRCVLCVYVCMCVRVHVCVVCGVCILYVCMYVLCVVCMSYMWCVLYVCVVCGVCILYVCMYVLCVVCVLCVRWRVVCVCARRRVHATESAQAGHSHTEREQSRGATPAGSAVRLLPYRYLGWAAEVGSCSKHRRALWGAQR